MVFETARLAGMTLPSSLGWPASGPQGSVFPELGSRQSIMLCHVCKCWRLRSQSPLPTEVSSWLSTLVFKTRSHCSPDWSGFHMHHKVISNLRQFPYLSFLSMGCYTSSWHLHGLRLHLRVDEQSCTGAWPGTPISLCHYSRTEQ